MEVVQRKKRTKQTHQTRGKAGEKCIERRKDSIQREARMQDLFARRRMSPACCGIQFLGKGWICWLNKPYMFICFK